MLIYYVSENPTDDIQEIDVFDDPVNPVFAPKKEFFMTRKTFEFLPVLQCAFSLHIAQHMRSSQARKELVDVQSRLKHLQSVILDTDDGQLIL